VPLRVVGAAERLECDAEILLDERSGLSLERRAGGSAGFRGDRGRLRMRSRVIGREEEGEERCEQRQNRERREDPLPRAVTHQG
jgi:hypothetical protein